MNNQALILLPLFGKNSCYSALEILAYNLPDHD